jgi:hypothetical protein
MKYLIPTTFIFLFFFSSCNGNVQNKTIDKGINQSSASFIIDFPNTGIEIVKSEKVNPEFPDSKVVNWVLEGKNKDGEYMYFVAQDILSSSLKEDIKLVDDGLDQFLRSVLGGGVSNYRGQNLLYHPLLLDRYHGLEVNSDFFYKKQKGIITYRGYCDGHNLFIVGVVNQNREDPNIKKFLNSFEII